MVVLILQGKFGSLVSVALNCTWHVYKFGSLVSVALNCTWHVYKFGSLVSVALNCTCTYKLVLIIPFFEFI